MFGAIAGQIAAMGRRATKELRKLLWRSGAEAAIRKTVEYAPPSR
jgi:hypothetical protein